MTFREKLVILRKIKGITQEEFACAVGVSRQAVYKWESGQSYPEVPKLLEMKLLFTISIDELLDDNYDLPVPEKKKRKRAPKADTAKVEVKPAPKAAPAPKAEPKVEAAPAPKAEPKVETKPAAPVAPTTPVAPVAPAAPKVEAAPAPKAEPKVEVKPAAPKSETALPKINVAPAPKAEPKVDSVPTPDSITLSDLDTADETPAKKTGFFDRIFGRR